MTVSDEYAALSEAVRSPSDHRESREPVARKAPQQPLSRESEQFNLRLPDGMRDRIKALAANSRRTMTAEIVHRLERTIQQDQREAEDSRA